MKSSEPISKIFQPCLDPARLADHVSGGARGDGELAGDVVAHGALQLLDVHLELDSFIVTIVYMYNTHSEAIQEPFYNNRYRNIVNHI